VIAQWLCLIQRNKGCEARDLFIDTRKLRPRCGLLSVDVDLGTIAPQGNFSETNSMTVFALTAIKLSRNWEDRYWRSWS